MSGTKKEPLKMARGCSPKGVVKKHNLYNKQPKDWGRGGKGGGGEVGRRTWKAELERLHV